MSHSSKYGSSALQELDDYIRMNEKGLDSVSKSKLDRGVYFRNEPASKTKSSSFASVRSDASLEKTLVHFVDHLKNLQKIRSTQLKQVHRLLSMEMDIEEQLNTSVTPASLTQHHLSDADFESYLLGDDGLHDFEDDQLKTFNLNGDTLNSSQFLRQSQWRQLNSRATAESSSSSRARRGGFLRYADVNESYGTTSQYAPYDNSDTAAAAPPPPPMEEKQQVVPSGTGMYSIHAVPSSSSNCYSSDVEGMRVSLEQQIRDSQLLLNRIDNVYTSEEDPQPRSPLCVSPKPTTPTMTPSFTGFTLPSGHRSTKQEIAAEPPYGGADDADNNREDGERNEEEVEGSDDDDDSDYWRRTSLQQSFVDSMLFQT